MIDKSEGIAVGGYTLGCLFGAIPTIWIGNKLGRRKTIFLGSSIMIVGALLQCTSFGLAQLIVARFITGVGQSPVAALSTLADSSRKWHQHVHSSDVAVRMLQGASTRPVGDGGGCHDHGWHLPELLDRLWLLVP